MRRVIPLSLFLLAACGPQDAVTTDFEEEYELADAPLLGANGQDAADRGCHVVLRKLERIPYQGGYETKCGTTGCFVVWKGFIDISAQAAAEGARPYVLFKNLSATSWTRASTTKTTGAPAGFVRYSVRLDRNTLSDGMSFSSLQRAKVEVAPYLLTKTGARLFDHNRLPGDFDVYALAQATGWSVKEDASVCAPKPTNRAVLDFKLGWQNVQRGALVAGAKGTITYALGRLPDCRGTHNGYPAWDVRAYVRFSPGGQLLDGSVRGFNSPTGTPSNSTAVPVPFDFDVPAGATSAEVWFVNATGAGSSCIAYDSNLGSNYRFTVEPRPFAAVQWAGNAGSSFSRACSREQGVPDPVRLDSYIQQRACSFVEVDVYVPGLTDGGAVKGAAVWAEAELSLDGQALAAAPMAFVGRVGNDYRYRFELPRSELYSGPKWTALSYTPRFSTDGVAWTREATRRVVRDETFCNPAWGGCAP